MELCRKIVMVLGAFIHLFLLVAGLALVVYGREMMALVDVSSFAGVPLLLLVVFGAKANREAAKKVPGNEK